MLNKSSKISVRGLFAAIVAQVALLHAASGQVATYITAAQIPSNNLSAYSSFETNGYATGGDGGGAWYIKTGATPCGIADSTGQIWSPDPSKTINVLACGAKGDGVTDDTNALNNTIRYGETWGSSYNYGPVANVFAPPGRVYKTTGPVYVLSKIVNIDFEGQLAYANTTGTAFTVAAANPGYFSLCKIKLSSVQQTVGQNTGIPTTINLGGATGVQINYATFCDFEFDNIQGFTSANLYLDGLGDFYSPQVVAHNNFELGQIVYGGAGIKTDSTSSATSNFQGNYVHCKDCYSNLINAEIDDSSRSATDSNTFLFDAMDDSGLNSNGGHGILIYGWYNHIVLAYRGGSSNNGDVYFAGSSDYNILEQTNPLSTSGPIFDGTTGTHNKCTIAGVAGC